MKFGEHFSFRVVNVHAKFRHIDVFWKSCTNFITTFVLGSNWPAIDFQTAQNAG